MTARQKALFCRLFVVKWHVLIVIRRPSFELALDTKLLQCSAKSSLGVNITPRSACSVTHSIILYSNDTNKH